MKVSIDPPVDVPMRRALAELLGDRTAEATGRIDYDDVWRRAGLQEGVARDGVDSDYALSPRSTRGATRA